MTALALGDTLAAVARPAVGTILRDPTQRGISYALKVTFQGQRHRVTLGGSWEGWDEARVQEERELIAKLIARGEWVPPRRDGAVRAVTVAGDPPTFQVFASEHAGRRRRRLSENAYKDLVWRLRCGMDHFGPYELDKIDEVVIEDFVQDMLAEREEIRAAAAAGRPLMQTICLPNGRTYERRRKALSNDSINKAIAAVRQVLKDASRRYPRHVVRNPAADRDVYLATAPEKRSYLEAHHMEALLDGAAQLDGRHGTLDWDKVQYIRASDKSAVKLARDLGVSDVLIGKVRRGLVWVDEPSGNRPQRRAIIGTLVLAGLRIGELCGLALDRLDLAGGRILIPARDMEMTGPQTKTAAGERVIPMVPALHGILLDARAVGGTGAFSRSSSTPNSSAFCTRKGTSQTPSNVAHHVLSPAVADELLRQRGQTPMPRVTPHTLRRTFASILAECDVPARRAMYLLGHRDAKLTLSVYQQVLDMGGDAVETLERVLGAPLDNVGEFLRGRAPRRPAPVLDVGRALHDLIDADR